ncbi:MAG TPA: MFS transporter [Candidatus Limnocylindrales bacterium]|jgi:MFS family permease
MNEQTRLPFDDLPEPIGEAPVTTVAPPARDAGPEDLPGASRSVAASDAIAGPATLELPFGPDESGDIETAPITASAAAALPPTTADEAFLAVEDAADVDATVGGVLRNRRFLALWLAQVASQIGGNMVLFGLTVMVADIAGSSASVSLLILTFLVPAVVFSAPAGVFVDRVDRRIVLVATNVARGGVFILLVLLVTNITATDTRLLVIYGLNIVVSTLTVFFAPAEASMIPMLVDRRQLLAANSLFTLTLQAAFAIGFALLGPLAVSLSSVIALVIFVAILYFVAAALCVTLPAAPPTRGEAPARGAIGEAEQAMASMAGDLREGIAYIRDNRSIFWSLSYLAISASLIGVMGVLGPAFARDVLGLTGEGLAVLLLPLGAGLVIGILLLNAYGRLFPRRRVIEGGLIGLAVSIALLALAEPISTFLKGTPGGIGNLVSLLGIVVMLALASGIGYAFVAVPAQTQLQEELPEDIRGRVFGVLNMLVNIASFLPIILVGYIADGIGPDTVLLACAVLVFAAGIRSMVAAPPLVSASAVPSHLEPTDPITVTTQPRPRRVSPPAEPAPRADDAGPASR